MKKKIIIGAAVIILAALVIFGAVYVNDYYRADAAAIAAFTVENGCDTYAGSDGITYFIPDDPRAGLIFYPGGKVEHTAYVPLMEALASEGVACALVEMPFNLAVLDINAADRVELPGIDRWYIAGHSLGGAMGSGYAASHTEKICGVVLLGAYSTSELTCPVLTVYGSEDGVMNREKYDKYKPNLPDGFAEKIIPGGCHAGFGMYGPQEGDGVPTISAEEQIRITAAYISDFILK